MRAVKIASLSGVGFHQAFLVILAALILPAILHAKVPRQKTHHPVIEKAHFDWSGSGTESTFSIFQENDTQGEAFDRLTIETPGKKRWNLRSRNGEWISISDPGPNHLLKPNLLTTAHRLFFASSGSSQARIYLILKGQDAGCCVGSLTILTPDQQGQPKVVFHSSSHLLAALASKGDGDALEVIGQLSDSEARATNVQSYNPYRVYVLSGSLPARYDLALSKSYTIAHYCQWHGPEYNEKFVAVGPTTGADHCHVISDSAFMADQAKHPERFPE